MITIDINRECQTEFVFIELGYTKQMEKKGLRDAREWVCFLFSSLLPFGLYFFHYSYMFHLWHFVSSFSNVFALIHTLNRFNLLYIFTSILIIYTKKRSKKRWNLTYFSNCFLLVFGNFLNIILLNGGWWQNILYSLIYWRNFFSYIIVIHYFYII